ncbi:MAG: hypothetical protein IH935_00665 [Acidobacteria bacterium]|nr:hypothetical protein [Acidobacteriota bacterium]
MINSLKRRIGEEPMFSDVAVEQLGTVGIRADQYYGKPFATAAQEFLTAKRQACPAEEVLRGLQQGGFDFRTMNWKEDDRLRGLAISLAKNVAVFHKLPNNTFGLVTWYPDVANKREKQKRGNGGAGE